jgi:hypothetical protein
MINLERSSTRFFKVKKRGFPVHAIKAHRGSRGIAPLMLNLSTRWR